MCLQSSRLVLDKASIEDSMSADPKAIYMSLANSYFMRAYPVQTFSIPIWICSEFDRSSGIKNVIFDRLNVGELQVDDISANPKNCGRKYKEICTSQVNKALSSCFFGVFSENCGREISTTFQPRWSCMYLAAAGFYESLLKFKE